ncbi:RNA-binding KH domain-containing PEPPER [Olea europaea subsp. europaea]|uniref:RNA-binding KH domain-containing PEPPER n=1 Tax=Olea europaea subsp. europaea TaxID=158383 RepID=A0A8S0QTY9_OLEEU|nr:RNA-binding KH domain-containing PEPPER [Olea europaea subsp. europaea]
MMLLIYLVPPVQSLLRRQILLTYAEWDSDVVCVTSAISVSILDFMIWTLNQLTKQRRTFFSWVLISGKEEPESPLSPAIDAVIRIFKRINGLPENNGDGKALGAAGIAFCSIRLLVASSQGISLIGKQGSLIKSIQESTSVSIRILSNDEMPVYASSEERIVELQGETLKVLRALEAVVGHLRKFLVDHTVLPLFEKSYNAPLTQERLAETKFVFDLLIFHIQAQQGATPIGCISTAISFSTYFCSIAQTMQIPLAYAEDIIGVKGANIDYIRRTSGAILTVLESRGLHDKITVEIKGTSSQVQTAQQLIQEFTSGHRDTLPETYGNLELSLRPSYSQLGSGSYSSSLYREQPYDGYGSSGLGELLEAELRLQRKEEVEATNKTIVDKMLMQMKKSDPDPL